MTDHATAAHALHTDLTPPRPYLDDLVRGGVLVETGTRGVYGKSASFERVLDAFDSFITRTGERYSPEVLRFPPVISRATFERSGYLRSFPHLAGAVAAFRGSDRDYVELLAQVESGNDWASAFHGADVVLTPAACYPVYAHASGELPSGGRLFDVQSYCFRHEPSDDPARMQMFRMHELVRLGDAGGTIAFRDAWIERARAMLTDVGLAPDVVVASDPFFGRAGKMMAASQAEQALKFELVVPIASSDAPTAVASCNYHQDHFGKAFDITAEHGATAHTACVGFGLERITLALFRVHGFRLGDWPAPVRATLAL